jgi:Tol biopolymer transport system component
MRKAAFALTLNMTLLFSAFFVSLVQAEEWSTIKVSPSNFETYGVPSITYNGSKIAFSTGNLSVFNWSATLVNMSGIMVNLDGTELTQVTNDSRINDYPQISWDGKKIAFHSYIQYYLGDGDPFSKDHKIFVANSDGTGLTEIARDCSFPVLSGDGSKIAFTKKDQLFVVNFDGTGLTQVTNKTVNKRPSISGDGSKIAFVSESQLFVVNSDGTGLTSPLFTASDISRPSISGDGKKIAFYADLDANYERFQNYSDAFVVNSDGTGLIKLATNLTLFDYHGVTPSISADGSKIAFVSNDYEVFVVNSDGTELTQIPGFPKGGHAELSISGDGSVIAFAVSGTLFVSVNSDRVLSDNGSEDDATSLETQQTMQTLEIVVAASAVAAAIICTGLLFYFKKRKH